MKYSCLRLYMVITVLVVVLSMNNGCSKVTNSPSIDMTKSVRVFIKDAPGAVEQLNVTVQGVGFNVLEGDTDNGWQYMNITPVRVNLLDFRTSELQLGSINLPSGTYHQLRLILADDATIKFAGDNTLYPLTIPNSEKTGLKMNLAGINVDENNIMELVIDIDADKFINETTPGNYEMRSTALNVGVRVVSGGKIVFENCDGPWSIYIMDEDGSNLRCLTNLDGNYCPGISPDNSKIVFRACRTNCGLMTMDVDGSNQQSLNVDGIGAWSPDGSKIVFQTCSYDADYAIGIMNSDGSALTKLSEIGCDPCWSPDGTKIAFISDDFTGIRTMRSDGSDKQTILTFASGGIIEIESLSWSKKDKIVFAGYYPDASYSDLFIINANGSGLTSISGTDDCRYPAWSPDGSKIVYCNYKDLNKYLPRIYVMNADGTDRTRLTDIGGLLPKW